MEQTECSETSAYKIQTPRNYPEENIQQVRTYSPECPRLLFLRWLALWPTNSDSRTQVQHLH